VQRRTFDPKTEEGEGGWWRLCNEELHNFYASPNTILVIKSSMMRWEGHVEHIQDLCVDGRIILEWVLGE